MVKNLPSNTGDAGSIPDQGTRSHMHAATKSWHAAIKSSHVTTKESVSHNEGAHEPQIRSLLPQLRLGATKIKKIRKKKGNCYIIF